MEPESSPEPKEGSSPVTSTISLENSVLEEQSGSGNPGPNATDEEDKEMKSESSDDEIPKGSYRGNRTKRRKSDLDSDDDSDSSSSSSFSTSSSSSSSSSSTSAFSSAKEGKNEGDEAPMPSTSSGRKKNRKRSQKSKQEGKLPNLLGKSKVRKSDERSSPAKDSDDSSSDDYRSIPEESEETTGDDLNSTREDSSSNQRDISNRSESNEEEQPDPEVLSKPGPRPRYPFVKDLMNRHIDARMSRIFEQRRIGSVDLTRRFELNFKLEGHDGCVNALHFNETGNLLASGSDDRNIIVWDWENRKKKTSFSTGHKSNVFQSKFLPLAGNGHIVSTSRDGQVRLTIISGDGRNTSMRLAQHRGSCNKLALLPRSPHTLITCGEDGVLYSVDVRESDPTKLTTQRDSQDGNPVGAYTVNAHPMKDQYIITAGKDPYVRMYDRRYLTEDNFNPTSKFCPQKLLAPECKHSITCATWNWSGNRILASYNDEEIYLFETESTEVGKFVKKYQGHRNSETVKGVNFYGPKSEFVISGSDCGNVFLWDTEAESIVTMFKGDEAGVVNVLEPHPHLPILATSGLDSEVKIWFPSSSINPDKDFIAKTVIKNAKERNDNTIFMNHDWFEGRMLLMMLSQLRNRRRRAEGGRESDESDSDRSGMGNGGNAGSNDEDDDGEDDFRVPQCPSS